MIEVKVERVVGLVENPNARVFLLHARHGVSVALHHSASGQGERPNSLPFFEPLPKVQLPKSFFQSVLASVIVVALKSMVMQIVDVYKFWKLTFQYTSRRVQVRSVSI
jgi:hypothetical protein